MQLEGWRLSVALKRPRIFVSVTCLRLECYKPGSYFQFINFHDHFHRLLFTCAAANFRDVFRYYGIVSKLRTHSDESRTEGTFCYLGLSDLEFRCAFVPLWRDQDFKCTINHPPRVVYVLVIFYFEIVASLKLDYRSAFSESSLTCTGIWLQLNATNARIPQKYFCHKDGKSQLFQIKCVKYVL